MRDGTRKVVHITEVSGMEGDVITMTDIFVFEQSGYEEGKVVGRLRQPACGPSSSIKSKPLVSTCLPRFSVLATGDGTNRKEASQLWDPMILILIIGGGFAFTLLIVGLVVTARSERSLVKERLGRYMDEEITQVAPGGAKASPVGDWLDRQLEKSSWVEVSRESWRGRILSCKLVNTLR